MKDEIDVLGEQKEKVTVVTDGVFKGKENQKLAERNNIGLVPTDLMGKDVNEPDQISK